MNFNIELKEEINITAENEQDLKLQLDGLKSSLQANEQIVITQAVVAKVIVLKITN